MTTESTEIKITTAHAETMIETTTTYDMMMMPLKSSLNNFPRQAPLFIPSWTSVPPYKF